ncbi:TPA: 9-O-acetylesterase, partial [Candidatus Poribacteria bacterium]|nr:9-O-acetylesterase [Candidatus Poribacteria bacterium]
MLENSLYLLLFPFFSVVSQNTCEKLQIPHIFGDHMVIQRDKPIRMWGSAEPEATVQVRLAELNGITKADQHGTWLVELEALSANAEGTTLSVTSNSETIEYQDVIIGDVWILGGQSNMEDELENVYH